MITKVTFLLALWWSVANSIVCRWIINETVCYWLCRQLSSVRYTKSLIRSFTVLVAGLTDPLQLGRLVPLPTSNVRRAMSHCVLKQWIVAGISSSSSSRRWRSASDDDGRWYSDRGDVCRHCVHLSVCWHWLHVSCCLFVCSISAICHWFRRWSRHRRDVFQRRVDVPPRRAAGQCRITWRQRQPSGSARRCVTISHWRPWTVNGQLQS